MSEQNWGIGNAKDAKPFDKVLVGDKMVDLIFGEHPHSRRDNNVYAKLDNGTIQGFDGHRRPFKIEIEETNYLKDSHYSGSEIRKGGSVKVYCNGVLCFEDFTRSYENGYRIAHNFIIEMEENWSWFPLKTEEKIGKIVSYREQLFKIERVIVSQACLILVTVDGKPRKKFQWEDEEDVDEYELTESLKVEITSKQIWWHPNINKL